MSVARSVPERLLSVQLVCLRSLRTDSLARKRFQQLWQPLTLPLEHLSALTLLDVSTSAAATSSGLHGHIC